MTSYSIYKFIRTLRKQYPKSIFVHDIEILLQALDKYTEDNKRVYVNTYQTGSQWDNIKQCWVAEKEDTPKEKKWKKGKRKEIRKELGLTDEMARKFDECDTNMCVHCEQEALCSEYMYAMMDVDDGTVDSYDEMMKSRYGYGWGGE